MTDIQSCQLNVTPGVPPALTALDLMPASVPAGASVSITFTPSGPVLASGRSP